MSVISIYIDEDAMDGDLVSALRSRGISVVTASDAGLTGKTDEEQLAASAELGCALSTFGVSDYYRIHAQWTDAGREHGGMILASQKR